MATLDLKTAGSGAATTSCDVCIVGAGAAGLYLANRLAQAGLRVAVVEAGGDKCLDGPSVGIDALLTDTQYGATTAGRAFGLGGTTSRWGGQLIPHSGADVRSDGTDDFDPWRHILEVVRTNSQRVHSVLGLESANSYFSLPPRLLRRELTAIRSAGLAAIAAQWLPFRRRNLRSLVENSRSVRERVRVYLHAVACTWNIVRSPDGDPAVRSVRARSSTGNVLDVSARAFVVAAGAIESARILLEMQQQSDEPLFPRGTAVGAYLSDHLSCRIARVADEDVRAAALRFGPRFRGGTMRSLKFVPAAPSSAEPRWCCHFVFDLENPGFRLARKVLAGMQARTRPRVTGREMFKGTGGLIRLAGARLLRRRLYVPPRSAVFLQLNIEQAPKADNGVRLSADRDAYGRPLPVVQWRMSDDDDQNIRDVTDRLLAAWPAHLARLRPEAVSPENAGMTKPHDVYHPVGTCRLGTDGQAVVDPELRVHGMSNLSVLSTAVFPSAGTANPTFSMLCFAERLAGRLLRETRSGAGRRGATGPERVANGPSTRRAVRAGSGSRST